jgi:hypothetical protein
MQQKNTYAHVVQLDELFLALPSERNNFQEEPIVPALKQAQTDRFGFKPFKTFLDFFQRRPALIASI